MQCRKGNTPIRHRGVAQSGSAPGLGPGGRRFESCHPDKSNLKALLAMSQGFFLFRDWTLWGLHFPMRLYHEVRKALLKANGVFDQDSFVEFTNEE